MKARQSMDVFIAAENIKKFNNLLLVEKDQSQKGVLLELLALEKEKLAVAVAAQAKPVTAAAQKLRGQTADD
jgi:pyruvate/2-oxoglutarate/acetoin dehydrogenase E1 component